jgi:hypothetical protein
MIYIPEVRTAACFVPLTKEDLNIPECNCMQCQYVHINFHGNSSFSFNLSLLNKIKNTSSIRKWGEAKLLHTLAYEVLNYSHISVTNIITLIS